ncbi:MAG: MBL fold metallo-hydrolase [Rhodocyclaceae bacterium]|nr:MAG: MBL fold metallo-hydrolase [Rhodocyclaceae bacterium]
MRKVVLPVIGVTAALSLAASMPAAAQSLEGAVKALGAADTHSLSLTGTGQWFQFGQAPNPTLAWLRFDVSRYAADFNYDSASARVQITRSQTIEPGRLRPAPVEQKVDQYVSGAHAWNLPTGNAANPAPTPQPTALAERLAEIWSTPQGFLRAAQANNARSVVKAGEAEVSFTVDGHYRFVGVINAANQVVKVRTWIDSPVLGDTLVETRFFGYRNFGNLYLPSQIERVQGGYPVLDLQISDVKANPAVDLPVPAEVAGAKPAVPTVTVTKLAEGVLYLTGGTHHSVAIEQKDHVVVVEAPLNEERSQAVIAKVKEAIPGKPIRFLVNTHAHFDHSGGLRTFVNEGAAIVTPAANVAYYRKIWGAQRSINPDSLAKSHKNAQFAAVEGKRVLTDGKRRIEIHSIAGSGHSDAFALIYLPAEKILIEADAYTPTAANVPPPSSPNPYSVNLYDNIRKLGLDVEQIAALHGPRVVTLNDLRTAIGQASVSR